MFTWKSPCKAYLCTICVHEWVICKLYSLIRRLPSGRRFAVLFYNNHDKTIKMDYNVGILNEHEVFYG